MKLRELTVEEKEDIKTYTYRISRFIKDLVCLFNTKSRVGFSKNHRFVAEADEDLDISFKTGILFSKYLVNLFSIKDYNENTNARDCDDIDIIDYLTNLVCKITDVRFKFKIVHCENGNRNVIAIINRSDIKYI